jgi:hypothetical protein
MPLPLPNLDDRSYTDLVEEARRLIPTYAPEWTNHNPSDPGIMLVELFAYLTEMLIFRLNRVTDDNERTFLRLLNGPDWQPTQALSEEIRLAVLSVRERYRAVTCEDFELLATDGFNLWLAGLQRQEQKSEPLDEVSSVDEWWQVTGLDAQATGNSPVHVARVQRAHCVAQRNLDAGSEMARTQVQPDHLSVMIVSANADSGVLGLGPQPDGVLRQALWGYLDQRRLLTTRHHVVGPFYAPVRAEILIARRTDVLTETLRSRVIDAINAFLDPLTGGPDGKGWPFGRDIYVSELYARLEIIEGLDYVLDIGLFSECKLGDERCVSAPRIWHSNGELIGLQLADHHLPAARLDPAQIVIAANAKVFAVQVTLNVRLAPTIDPQSLNQAIRTKVMAFFHPLYNGPGPNNSGSTDIMLQPIAQAVSHIFGVQQVTSLQLQSDATRLLYDTDQNVSGLHVEAGEMVDLHLQLEVSNG